MNYWARANENNRIAELITFNPAGRYDSSIKFYPINFELDEIQQNYNLFILKNEVWIKGEETVDITIKRIIDYIQYKLDEFAKEKGYDSILSAVSYSTSDIPKFKAEGIYAKKLRDSVWNKANELFNEFKSEQWETIPTMSEIIQELPEIKWPNEL